MRLTSELTATIAGNVINTDNNVFSCLATKHFTSTQPLSCGQQESVDDDGGYESESLSPDTSACSADTEEGVRSYCQL